MPLRITALLLILFTAVPAYTAPAEGANYETLAEGRAPEKPGVESALVKDGETLAAAAGALGAGGMPDVDFSKDAVLVIIPENPAGGAIEIRDVAGASGGAVEVFYAANLMGPPPESGETSYPFLVVKVPGLAGASSARFVDVGAPGAVTPGTALGQEAKYTNVLLAMDNPVAAYLPLDKGNRWTYSVESQKGSGELTNAIVAEADGWSVYDKFFGMSGVSMQVLPDGVIMATSQGETKPFYTDDVVTEFEDETIKTPAGEFGDILIVTIPEGGPFWFRDVYARGVGLILHEHDSARGQVKYTLVGAKVRGKTYPQ
ncbi:MAG TPA: hypothetical protein PKC29_13985 [Thermodesulfobacteriota bacterium]|nr:hypothetical protein [Thermodesulfobacteriota bacterium]